MAGPPTSCREDVPGPELIDSCPGTCLAVAEPGHGSRCGRCGGSRAVRAAVRFWNSGRGYVAAPLTRMW